MRPGVAAARREMPAQFGRSSGLSGARHDPTGACGPANLPPAEGTHWHTFAHQSPCLYKARNNLFATLDDAAASPAIGPRPPRTTSPLPSWASMPRNGFRWLPLSHGSQGWGMRKESLKRLVASTYKAQPKEKKDESKQCRPASCGSPEAPRSQS